MNPKMTPVPFLPSADFTLRDPQVSSPAFGIPGKIDPVEPPSLFSGFSRGYLWTTTKSRFILLEIRKAPRVRSWQRCIFEQTSRGRNCVATSIKWLKCCSINGERSNDDLSSDRCDRRGPGGHFGLRASSVEAVARAPGTGQELSGRPGPGRSFQAVPGRPGPGRSFQAVPGRPGPGRSFQAVPGRPGPGRSFQDVPGRPGPGRSFQDVPGRSGGRSGCPGQDLSGGSGPGGSGQSDVGYARRP